MEYRFSSDEYFLIYMLPSSRKEGDLIVVEMMDHPFEHFYEFASHCKNYACHSREEYLNFDPQNHDKVQFGTTKATKPSEEMLLPEMGCTFLPARRFTQPRSVGQNPKKKNQKKRTGTPLLRPSRVYRHPDVSFHRKRLF